MSALFQLMIPATRLVVRPFAQPVYAIRQAAMVFIIDTAVVESAKICARLN
jgi:hypothetical protein